MSHKWLLSGLFLISRSEKLWTKASTGLQVIPHVSVLIVAYIGEKNNYVDECFVEI